MLNKIIGVLVNPMAVASMAVTLAACAQLFNFRRAARWIIVACVAWAWLWSTPLMSRMLGATLEKPFLIEGCVKQLESFPVADAIELHGGSMGDSSGIKGRGEMWASADRVWMAARLWRAQARKVKVEGEGEQWRPKLFVTGGGVKKSTAGLLEDFGIPTNAIVFAEEPRNTEEEAKFIAGAMNQVKVKGQGQQRNCSISSVEQCNKNGVHHSPPQPSTSTCTRPRVLVVTSAWHMKRTMMMYAKYAPNVEAIPAPCDFENSLDSSRTIGIGHFFPQDEVLVKNRIVLHEWIGIIGYRLKWLVVGD